MNEKNKKRKAKRRHTFLRNGLALLILALIVFAARQFARLWSSNATTAIAHSDAIGKYHNGTLVIARNESLIERENATSVDFVADEGSHITQSAVICKVYSAGFNETEINRLNTYREEIQAYHINQVFDTYVDAQLDSYDAELSSLAQQVRTLVQGRGIGSLVNLERQIESEMNARKNYLRQKYPDDQVLSELYKVENDQLKKIESWTTTYTASEDCIVSFYTDGYEPTINSSTYQTLTPSDVKSVIHGIAPDQSAVSRGSDPIYRTVRETEWYALFLCQDKDWNPVVGQKYSMQLEGFDNYVIEGEVQSFSRIGSDLLLRMRVDSNVEPVLNIRTCSATVGDFVSGLSVPMRALYTYDNQIGVVVLDSGVQTFVGVTVISYKDENTAFVRPNLNGSPLENGKTVMLF